MIDEYYTWIFFGYHSDELSSGSHQRVVAVCDECGLYRDIENKAYRELCSSCARIGDKNPMHGKRGAETGGYGKHPSPEELKCMSERMAGSNNPMYGKKRTPESVQKQRDNSNPLKGEDHPWFGMRGEELPWFGRNHSEEDKIKMRKPHPSIQGKNHPRWKGGDVEVICHNCGNVFMRQPSALQTHNFCGRKCWIEYTSTMEHRILLSVVQHGINKDEWSGFTSKQRNHVLHKNRCKKLNGWFMGSEAHHITKSIVAYIPSELHRHVPHNIKTGSNMGEINMLALQYTIGWW